MNQQSHVYLHLFLIPGIGPSTINRLSHALPKNCVWSDLYAYGVQDFLKLGISLAAAKMICAGLKDRSLLDKELALIHKHGISWTSVCDASYPPALADTYLPPTILYWQGADLALSFDAHIAVVGSREANNYGLRIINQLVPSLVEHGFTIVSGGAIGADSMAHRATLQAGGKTIVVGGSGLLNPYPARNRGLFEEIVERGGSLVSIFPLEMNAHQGNFPARNRVISGLSRGCVVIQAAAESGARITAQYALDQGRTVFCIPGSLEDPLSAGCHALILEGAKLIRNVDDILEDFGVVREIASKKDAVVAQSYSKKTVAHGDNPVHQKIIESCAHARSFDELMNIAQISLAELQDVLFNLQLEGLVYQNHAGLWALVS